jgi:homoserine O-succinyltransferase
MPVFLDSGSGEYRRFSPIARTSANTAIDHTNAIRIGLVNNMPDTALDQTERQILKLLDAAAGSAVVILRYFSIEEVERSELGKRHLDRHKYVPVADLENTQIDALLVTGAEPRAADLAQETYWQSLTTLLDWASENTISTICSCLAVHAAVRHFDGIDRYALENKCFGIFEATEQANHPLMKGVPPPLQFPHSRWNGLETDDLLANGYTVLLHSSQVGADTFVKEGRSLFVFFHGHPEYEAWTLLGEYRRDVERYLGHERDSYPAMPVGYFNEQDVGILNEFRKRALSDRCKSQMTNFPRDALLRTRTDPWRPAAARIYQNWLSLIAARKPDKRH